MNFKRPRVTAAFLFGGASSIASGAGAGGQPQMDGMHADEEDGEQDKWDGFAETVRSRSTEAQGDMREAGSPRVLPLQKGRDGGPKCARREVRGR